MEANNMASNMAAMREALLAVKKSIDEIGASSLDGDPEILMMSLTQVCARLSARIDAALAAPARNCDRYATADEAMDDFGDEALIEEWNALKAGKDRDMLAVELFVFTKWLYAPATETEGGAK